MAAPDEAAGVSPIGDDDPRTLPPKDAVPDPDAAVLATEIPVAHGTVPIEAPLPERIGRYRIERLLGTGGFGLVYLARDEQFERSVAIKVPHRKLVEEAGVADIYLTEARMVAKLDHPHSVPVYDVGQTEQFIEVGCWVGTIGANAMGAPLDPCRSGLVPVPNKPPMAARRKFVVSQNAIPREARRDGADQAIVCRGAHGERTRFRDTSHPSPGGDPSRYWRRSWARAMSWANRSTTPVS